MKIVKCDGKPILVYPRGEHGVYIVQDDDDRVAVTAEQVAELLHAIRAESGYVENVRPPIRRYRMG